MGLKTACIEQITVLVGQKPPLISTPVSFNALTRGDPVRYVD